MPSLGSYLLETAVTLVAVVILAVMVLYGGRRLGLGGRSGPIELVGRLPLDARRAVYLVRVGRLVYVVGASEAGLVRLGEMEGESLSFANGAEPEAGASSRPSGPPPAPGGPPSQEARDKKGKPA
jgi:flagellar biogenesis protein FliO